MPRIPGGRRVKCRNGRSKSQCPFLYFFCEPGIEFLTLHNNLRCLRVVLIEIYHRDSCAAELNVLVAEVAYTGHTGKVVAHRFPKGTGAGAV